MMSPPTRSHAAKANVRHWPLKFRFGLRSVPAPNPAPRSVGALLAIAFFALYAVTSAGTLSSRDGGVMYDTAMAIVLRHSLRLPPHHHGLPGVGGGFYSKYGIAQSVAEIPQYVVGQAVAALQRPPMAQALALAVTMLTNPLIMALAVWLFFQLAFELSPRVRTATIAAVMVGLASPLWPYAKTDFSEPLSALALTGAMLFLVRGRSRHMALNFGAAGMFGAIALLTKLTAGVALLALCMYACGVAAGAWRERRREAAGALLSWVGMLAAGAVLVGLYNVARYGHITDSGYYAADLPFHAPLVIGLKGLLFGSGKGLLWYCPLVLVALALWPRMLARRRAEGILALAMIALTLVVFATYPVWWGGICWGPRYLIPIIPLLLLPLAYMPEPHELRRRVRSVAAVVVAMSVLVQVLGVAVQPERYLRTGIRDAQYLGQLQYSPMLAHAWFAAYDVVVLVDRPDAAAMLKSYPWRHAGGTSATQRLVIGGWSYWWWGVLAKYGLHKRWQAAIAGILLLLLALALVRLWRILPSPGSLRREQTSMAIRVGSR